MYFLEKVIPAFEFPWDCAKNVVFCWYIHCSHSCVSTPADSQKIVLTLLTKFWLYVGLALTPPYFLIKYFHRWPGFGNAITCRFDWLCQNKVLVIFWNASDVMQVQLVRLKSIVFWLNYHFVFTDNLQLTNIQTTDNGTYNCEAENSQTEVPLLQTYILEVFGK